ncbi:rhomboid family intramembrane serine protease [Coraliomargarita sp. SDUM461004]|uniref:Rhomboid family intramembrane serine protease n=2 Tax=Thalassobacterium sedimentorum TaxID=3041258 RepID=A0ABU1AEG5_9BACT|nr:rhomboid family intramembrane serine protease [Coraliomargarita sp. SDUM461004]
MASLKNNPVRGEFSLIGFEAPDGLVPVAVYGSFASAGDAGLAILAMGKAYWTLVHDGQYVVCVAAVDATSVAAELRAISELDASPRRYAGTRYREFTFGYLSFLLYALLLVFCYRWQQGGDVLSQGRSDSLAMVADGEWARALTALCLHGDLVHLVSNLVAGMGFAFFVARFFGAASGWFLVLTSGVLGNMLNAWVYYPEAHYSIGASTAVFGALGLLTGVGLWVALSEAQESWLMPRWFMPVFGGITLLGLTGIGDGALHGIVDVAAHISGFLCGLVLGFVGAIFQRAFVYLEQQRYWVGLLTMGLVALAWASRIS